MSTHLDLVIESLLNKPIQQARLGHGSFLTFDLGRNDTDEDGRWEWHVWIYCCYWKLFQGESLLTHCEDNRLEIASIIESIGDQSITQVVVESDGQGVFRFSDGKYLEISPWEEEAESFMIFTPDKYVLTFNHDGTWDYTRGDNSNGEPLKHSLTPPNKG